MATHKRTKNQHRSPDGVWRTCTNPYNCRFEKHRVVDETDMDRELKNPYRVYDSVKEEATALKEELKNNSFNYRFNPVKPENNIDEIININNSKYINAVLDSPIIEGEFGVGRVRLTRVHSVVGVPPRVQYGWRLETGASNISEANRAVHKDEVFYLETLEETNRFKRTLHEGTGWTLRAINGDSNEKFIKPHRRMMATVMAQISSIETHERGVKRADQLGLSFFSNSDRDTLDARGQMFISSFRSSYIKDALNQPIYNTTNPDVAVVLYDDTFSDKSENAWTLRGINGKWTIIGKNKDGSTEKFGPYEDPEDISYTVYQYAEKRMGYPSHYAKSCGEKARDLVSGVDEAIDKHKIAVQERIEDHARRQAELTKRLQDKERSKTMLGKFKSFLK